MGETESKTVREMGTVGEAETLRNTGTVGKPGTEIRERHCEK